MSEQERIEFELNTARLWAALNAGDNSLRELEALTGVSASTLSRMSNGASIDMESFLKLCAYLDMSPGKFFDRVVWRKAQATPADDMF
jgi:DNA-binding Xre family transcriptional regulator